MICENDKHCITKEGERIFIGVVSNIMFPSDTFNIFNLELEKKDKLGQNIKVNCQYAGKVFLNERVKVTGKIIETKYGQQIKASIVEEIDYDTVEGIIAYLSSFIKGIGIESAKLVVNKFGTNTFKVLESNDAIKQLTSIKGIGKKKSTSILEEYLKKLDRKRLLEFGRIHNVSINKMILLENKYGINTLKIIKQNPYIITEVKGIGFKIADLIAKGLGIVEDDPYRINSLTAYILNEKNIGDTYIPLKEFVERTEKEEGVKENFENLILNAYYNFKEIIYSIKNEKTGLDETKIIKKSYILFDRRTLKEIDESYYITETMNINICGEKNTKIVYKFKKEIIEYIGISLNVFYLQEINIFEKLKKISISKTDCRINDGDLELFINKMEKEEKKIYAEKQKDILKGLFHDNLIVLTGGPGTGKSTISKAIMRILESNGYSFISVTPTGKASKRVVEATGYKSFTIHRSYHNNSLNEKLEVILVDEAGMLSVELAQLLLSKISDNVKIVFIGDVKQIPPVQEGNVFRDIIYLIKSGNLKGLFVELDKVQRNAGRISEIADDISKGIPSEFNNKDAQFHVCRDNNEIINKLKETLTNLINEGYNFNDIQIMAPMRKTEVGVDALNKLVQNEFIKTSTLFEKKYDLSSDKIIIKKNDKIIQKYNTKKEENLNEIVNGDVLFVKDFIKEDSIGALGDIVKKSTVVCECDGIDIHYPFEDFFTGTMPAYCLTTHKMQGSEIPIAIYILSESHYLMLNRNLLGTGWGRGKKRSIIIGTMKAYKMALSKEVSQTRNTIMHLISKNVNSIGGMANPC